MELKNLDSDPKAVTTDYIYNTSKVTSLFWMSFFIHLRACRIVVLIYCEGFLLVFSTKEKTSINANWKNKV